MSTTYQHTFNVLKALPRAAENYENPMEYEVLSGESVDAKIELTNNSLSSGRLFELDYQPETAGGMTTLAVHNAGITSAFVGNNVSAINFEGCSGLKAIEFADPSTITKIGVRCFKNVVNNVIIDLSSFTNLKEIEGLAFGTNGIKFPNNRAVIPPTVSSIGGVPNGSDEVIFSYVIGNTTYVNPNVDELEFKPLDTSNFPVLVFFASSYASGTHSILSSITLNDAATTYFIKNNMNMAYFGDDFTVPYRVMYLETLSGLHNAANVNGHFFGYSGTATSCDVYTFSNFPQEELENQDSTAFDGYLDLIPNEKFMSLAMDHTADFANLSVWVPTALYEAWRGAWPNYLANIYPYGPWEDRREMEPLTFEGGKSYIMTGQTTNSLTVEGQKGPATVTVTARDADVDELVPNP